MSQENLTEHTISPMETGQGRVTHDRIAVIDGNSLMHRAFHAIPASMSAPDGQPTNAIFGFLSMFIKMVQKFHPDGVICAFDKGKPTIRLDMYPDYKAHRPPMDPDLHSQFPIIKSLLQTMDVPVVELQGWEGDDILGTLAKQGAQEGYDMYLITGDRDMYQLSSKDVKIVSTRKGMSDVSIMTPESVESLYHGITPALVPDFYGLKGDTSDNIPGVPGIGAKRASDLIGKYGSLDEVIAHADEVGGKMGDSLRANIDTALLSRRLARIRQDAPIDFDFESARFPTYDFTRVSQAMGALGLRSIVSKLAHLRGEDAAAPAQSSEASERFTLKMMEGQEAEDALRRAMDSRQWLGVACSASRQKDTLPGLDDGQLDLFVASDKSCLHFSGEQQVRQALTDLFDSGLVVANNLKALIEVLAPKDTVQPALIDPERLDTSRAFDTSLAAYLLDSGTGAYSAGDISLKYLDVQLPEADGRRPQAALEAMASREVFPLLKEKLEQDGSKACYETIELPLVGVLAAMERRGMYVDRNRLAQQGAQLGRRIDDLATSIHQQAGESFNIDSPKQLSHILFDMLDLPTAGLKKTRTGYYSTNAKVLAKFAETTPFVQDVLTYREDSKIKSTYLDALPELIAEDGRIHTSFNQTVAATGRLSSSDPNLQNIPVRSELGRTVREAFSVPEGNVFLACDYSQIELRLLAHLSGDEHLIDAFCQGADFHAATAARIFNVGVKDVTSDLRSRAKAVNFGIVYGQQAYGLSETLHISRGEAQEMIDKYFQAYPGVRHYLDDTIAFAQRHGWVATMYGRKRHTPDIASKNFQLRSFAERTAMNHPMQGSAADIIKLAMIQVEQKIAQRQLKSQLILQIHDELDFQVPVEELEVIKELVPEVMEHVCELKVPLIAEVTYGDTWAQAK